MYNSITRWKLQNVFEQLSRGNYEPALAALAPRFEHNFLGDHAFGGTRHTATSFRQWFVRLFEVFPGLKFKTHAIEVNGPPWNSIAVVEWEDWSELREGGSYRNKGAHIIRLRWGRVHSLHVYLDTQKTIEACRWQAAKGLPQAGSPPITD